MTKRIFYTNWGCAFMIIIAIAFAPKYWIPLVTRDLNVSKDIHYHAVFASLWIIIYLAQVILISKNKIKAHQVIGYTSVLVTIGVIITGFYVSLGLVERALLTNSGGAKPLLLVNLLDMIMFGGIYSFAVIKRASPQIHKRAMTLSAIVLLNAALFRIGRFIIGAGLPSVILAIFLTCGLIVLYAILDKKLNGKLHPVIKKIGLIVIIIHLVRIPIAITPYWAKITDWILLNF